MARFAYTAMNESGARVAGTLEADSEGAALRMLEEKRLFPVSVKGVGAAASGKPRRRRVKAAELGLLYGQLADLLGSGVPLLRAMDSLVKSTPSPPVKELLREIRASVADGRSLTETLRQYPEVFPPLHTAMVQAGERAAFLEEVLRSLAGFIERFEELRSKVLGALIYPALLAGLGTVVMLAALMFFVPKFEPLLGNVKKPLPSEIMFTASFIVRKYWYLLIVGLAGVGGRRWTQRQNEAVSRKLE
ncbi:MAG: type II secretion system F family protein, partial [Verrucomicrobiota bacterium]